MESERKNYLVELRRSHILIRVANKRRIEEMESDFTESINQKERKKEIWRGEVKSLLKSKKTRRCVWSVNRAFEQKQKFKNLYEAWVSDESFYIIKDIQ